MRNKLVALLIVAGFCASGCAHTVDMDAWPKAAQNMSYATDICLTAFREKKLNTANEVMGCLMLAQRHMMEDVSLDDMSLFDVYAARVKLIADNIDAGQVPVPDGIAQYQAAQKQFTDTIVASLQTDERHREQMRRVFAAIGSGMQHYADANRHVHCDSSAFGNTVSTDCH